MHIFHRPPFRQPPSRSAPHRGTAPAPNNNTAFAYQNIALAQVPGSTLDNWLREFEKWLPDMTVGAHHDARPAHVHSLQFFVTCAPQSSITGVKKIASACAATSASGVACCAVYDISVLMQCPSLPPTLPPSDTKLQLSWAFIHHQPLKSPYMTQTVLAPLVSSMLLA